MSNIVTKATELVYQMNNDQLNQLVEAIKLKRSYLARQSVGQLSVGDTVEFDAKGHTAIVGRVEKINRKTVIVYQAGRGMWRVTANMLRKVEVV